MADPPLGMFGRFAVLKNASRELWLIFGVKFLAVAGYKLMNVTLVLWLSSDFGFTDQGALGLVAAWSLSITICTVLVGSVTDTLGIRRTLFLGIGLCVLARLVMVFATVKWVALACGLFPLAVGEALATPVLVAAIRKYSNTRQRSIAFSLFYSIMNLGFLVAGYVFDYIRKDLGEYGHFEMPMLGTSITTYRAVLLASLAVELFIFPVIYLLRRGVEVTDAGLHIVPEQIKYPNASLLDSFWMTARDAVRDTIKLFANLLQQAGFYRLLAFLMLIAFLKLIFMQIDYVFPKFGIRELGPGAPVGRLSALNNWLIILIVPFVGALTQRFPAYRMVMVGGLISAASVFLLALPTTWFQGMADGALGQFVGHWYLGLAGDVHPYYVMTAVFILFLSLGEAFYSPRVYEYAAAIAPKGQEASYAALSYIPFLLAKLLVGTVSGPLLAKYCPAEGPRNSALMWLIIALMATVAPVGLILFRRYIRVHESGRED